MLQTVQRPGKCNAVYDWPTMRYKEPLTCFDKNSTYSPNIRLPLVGICCYDCAESDVRQY